MDKTTQLTITFCELSEYPHIWEKDQTEKKMEEHRVVGEDAKSWMHYALMKEFGDACDPKEADPINMFVENDNITSMTISIGRFGKYVLTKSSNE